MSFFTFKKGFTDRRQIKEALLKIKNVDYRQQPTVYEALVKELADGGVKTEEIKRVVQELHQDGEISEADEVNLLELIKD